MTSKTRKKYMQLVSIASAKIAALPALSVPELTPTYPLYITANGPKALPNLFAARTTPSVVSFLLDAAPSTSTFKYDQYRLNKYRFIFGALRTGLVPKIAIALIALEQKKARISDAACSTLSSLYEQWLDTAHERASECTLHVIAYTESAPSQI
ncbi:hypothetical protein BJ165DRAFT_1404552 [Panaeolus papilionaceus]|nr:hypothetical protein BJ165DRAFT_1404552 [Panaeolus papilionaceus]